MYRKTIATVIAVVLASPSVALALTTTVSSEASTKTEGPPGWAEKAGIEDAEAGVRKREAEEAEKAAQERHTQEEDKSREEKERQAVAEREAELSGKETVAPKGAGAPQCIVPWLKGDPLSTARRVLTKAHCELGSVARPRRDHKVTLVVIRQQLPRDKRLPSGTRVGVTLGPVVTGKRR
jgi:hypothetical protein